MTPRRKTLSPHGLFFLAFCGLGAPALALNAGCSSEAQAAQPNQPEAAAEREVQADAALALVEAYNPNESLAPMLAKVQPAVVSIQASGEGRFGRQIGGIGSGFIISADGRVVTNHHVVAQHNHFEIELQDGRRYEAKVLGSDPQTDLAVLQLDGAKGLPFVKFGSSETIAVGDWVVAVGSPMGLNQTVTRGIVSAKGRGSLGLYRDGYADFLQTDAAINPGNSGGPLFNLRGEVVGINAAVGGHDGLGFAVPVDQAKVVIPKLIKNGKVIRGWLGVAGRDTPPDFGVMPEKGAVIGEVHADTPAADAGLRAGDRVVEIAGKAVDNFEDLRTRIGEFEPKETVELELIRAGKRERVKVVLGERPGAEALAKMTGPGGAPGIRPQPRPGPKPQPAPGTKGDLYGGQPARLGVEVRAQEGGGLVIERVLEGGVGHRLGLKAGDRLESVNGRSVDTVPEVIAALEGDRANAKVTVKRGRSTHTAVISGG